MDTLGTPETAVGCCGITSYLRDVLRGGMKFTVMAGSRHSKEKGLQIGAKSDMLVRDKVNNNGTSTCPRTRHFFSALRQRGITATHAQVTVSLPHLSLKTSIDVVGTSGKRVIVVEQKCTQCTLQEHINRYNEPCKKRRKLANGLLNTEFHAHQLQTAFGMLGLARRLPGVVIEGIVVICMKDGARIYDVRPEFVNEALFAVPRPRAAPARANFTKAPTDNSALEGIMSKLALLGYPIRESRLRYGSVVARGAKGYIVVALVHTPDAASKTSDRRRRDVQADTRKLWRAKRKKVGVRGCIFFYKDGDSTYKHEFVSDYKCT